MSSPYHNGSGLVVISCYCNYFSFLLFLMQGFTVASDTPSFKSVPTTVKTSEHDTVLLPCYVDDLGANVIKWWKDDTLIWDTSNKTLIVPANVRMFASNNTLEVSDVSASDTGEYICQVVRPAPWGPLNQIHAIEVQFPPTVSPIPLSSELEVALNEEVVMGCTSTGVPQPIISWSFEGKPIQLLTNRHTLTFKVTDRKMAGEYQCSAYNGVGEPAVASILLKVTYPPEVTADKLWIHSAPGLRSDLSCNVLSNPDSKVEWMKDGQVVDGLTRIVPVRIEDKYMLIIRNVRPSDFGYYLCKASNGIGQGQQTIQLSGIANTAVFKKNNKQANKYNITLIWEVDSYSVIIEYSLLFREHQLYSQPSEWTKLVIPADPDSLGPLHTQSYTLTSLKPSSIYEASVLSRNRFGWSRPSDVYRFSTAGIAKDDNNEGLIEDKDDILDKNVLTVDEDIDRNTIQTVISADFDVTYNTESMTSSTFRTTPITILQVICGVFLSHITSYMLRTM